MMKTALFSPVAAVVLGVLMTGVPAHAQLKVGVLNMEKALLDTAEMKKEQAAMEARYKPLQDRIAKLQTEIADIQKQLQTMGDKLKPEVQQQMANEGTKKQRDLQRLTEDLQADVDRDRNEILSRGRTRMETVITKLAEEKGLDMILDASSSFFHKPAFDVSAEVTAAYDKAYPLGK